nr:hypothetical protein [Verrucomicrobiota bacterium]
VQGLLEDFLVQQLEALPPATRSPAVALLSCLVTDGGTRNIVSGSDLLARVTESECVTEEAVAATLDDLVRKTGLVRQEFRDRTPFYQIISEFLIPWIREQKADRARIEAERTLAHERLAAAEKLAEERERAEQKLALQSAEADRLRAQDLATTLRSVRRARTALAILMLFALGGWSFAVLQTRQARRESRRAITEKNAADKARETAQSAEDGARTALEQTNKLAVASEQRLRAAGQVLGQTQQTTQDVLDAIHRVGPPADPAASTAWNQVVQKLQETVQRTETGGQQVSADIQLTKQEAATATSTPGWSLYGKLRRDGTWTDDRYFHKDGAALDLPAAGDFIIAETFVNVRKSPSAYDAQEQAWHLAEILGVIAPNQRLKVDEVRRTESAPGDPTVRVWIRAEPPQPTAAP